jgi:carboxylesterase
MVICYIFKEMTLDKFESTDVLSSGHDPTAPFFFRPGSASGGGALGVLLVHGYLTSPAEMRPLGEYLAAEGMTVLGIRLRGHATVPQALDDVPWEAWAEDVRAGLARLRETCARVSVAGLSLGGALALYVASQRSPARVVAMATPDHEVVRRIPVRWIDRVARVIPALPKLGSDVRDPAGRRARFTYDQVRLKSVVELVEFLDGMDGVLPHIDTPTLLIHARQDRVVPPASAERIAQQLGGPVKLRWLARGGHPLLDDYDRHIAFVATRNWLLGK